MSSSIPERLETPFDSEIKIEVDPKKEGIYAYNTIWGRINEIAISILCQSRSLYVSGLNTSKPTEIICISKASLLRFLGREIVHDATTFTENELQEIVRDIQTKSQTIQKESTSFTENVTLLLSKAQEIASKVTNPLEGETPSLSQKRQQLLEKCQETITWCNTQLEESKHLARRSIASLMSKEPSSQELFDVTGLQQREAELTQVQRESENLDSLVQYAQSSGSPLPEDYRNPQVLFQWFQERARENQAPPSTASAFIRNSFNISKVFSEQKAKIERLYAHQHLILPEKNSTMRELETLFSQSIQLTSLTTFDSTTEIQVDEKIQLFKDSVEEKILQLIEYSAKAKETIQLKHDAFARQFGLNTDHLIPELDKNKFYTTLAQTNEYRLLPDPGITSPYFEEVSEYNKIVLTELSRILQSIGLNITKVRPGLIYHTMEEYLAEVALANKYATIRAPNPALQHLINQYNAIAVKLRDQWLSQPCFAAMPRMIKITKNNLEKVLPFIPIKPLGEGSSKIAVEVVIVKPTMQKTKVLAYATFSSSPDPVAQASKIQRVNAEISSEAWISDELRHHGVPNLAYVRSVTTTLPGNMGYAYMDFCDGGTLYDFAQVHPTPSLKDRINMALELTQALAGMHKAGYCHGDMKILNALIQWSLPDPSGIRHPHAKLSDFGCTSRFGTPGLGQSTFIPPEIMEEKMSHRCDLPATAESDLWVLGDLLYSLKYGRSLLASPNPSSICLSQSMLNDPQFRTSMTTMLQIGSDLRSPGHDAMDVLIGELFQEDPALRPTAAQVATRLQAYLATL